MRHKNWVTRLPQTLRAAMSRPFSWGEHDCCLFTADCVIAICDFDPCSSVRGRYNSKASAFRLLKNEFGTLQYFWGRFFNVLQDGEAGRGDIVMFDGDEGLTMGVIWAGKIWAVTDHGARPVDKKIVMAWRVT
ncbi:hypothetical protein QE197_12380 [Arsenophonus nasoniae]|uniref:DUF6950 domain-containing protein n=3 Tax=Arsenophonus nasoniae TaxID=638 RepID=A0ABY8NKT4_9GAMM|nr:hypothetical protein [Arsenophonus nasoniae]WGM04491.1 hypothetical protein QE258_12740 [Arsenophonus nasoniae]WGM04550.1 hypothetical protein QE258_13115 [Arsenophonus nasoniae]WGM05068.1 hypothetical protein QE258_16060 [Arsenophonus nasoniae]WGM07526.1 hypothetical protein QE258_09955 [Arsenophonus nasoniae]WGM09660.1 hypothetical protein QE197_12380 [Arsenophonus nasoniae]